MSACDRCLALSQLTLALAQVPRLRGVHPEEPRFDDNGHLLPPTPGPFATDLAPVPAELVHAVLGLEPERARTLAAGFLKDWSAEPVRERAAEGGLALHCQCAPGYPECLRTLRDPPPVLHVRGAMSVVDSCPENAIAMVGTRRPTLVGREASRRIAAGIARADGIVVSGMALGVDGAAHQGALSVNGLTLAVLASGADRPSPSSHRRLYDEILERGAVVAELPPGSEPSNRWSFPARNRLIAALGKATVVVEAPLRSGALITVDHAHDLGRDVFAVPGSLASATSEGSNQLLCDGAGAVIDGAALAGDLGLERLSGRIGPREGPLAEVHQALARGPLSTDELARRATSLGPGELELALLDLELAGWVARRPDGRYRVVDRWAA
jgi:DNA processing protein